MGRVRPGQRTRSASRLALAVTCGPGDGRRRLAPGSANEALQREAPGEHGRTDRGSGSGGRLESGAACPPRCVGGGLRPPRPSAPLSRRNPVLRTNGTRKIRSSSPRRRRRARGNTNRVGSHDVEATLPQKRPRIRRREHDRILVEHDPGHHVAGRRAPWVVLPEREQAVGSQGVADEPDCVGALEGLMWWKTPLQYARSRRPRARKSREART